MPIRPPCLRFLYPSIPITRLATQMSFKPLNNPLPTPNTNPLPSFRRLFPFRLKYHYPGLGLARNLSTRAEPPRAEPPRAERSLIEEEEELSGWVSGLRTGSLRAGAVTDDEEDKFRGIGKIVKVKSKRNRQGGLPIDDNDARRIARGGGAISDDDGDGDDSDSEGGGFRRGGKRGREGGFSEREGSGFRGGNSRFGGDRDRGGGFRGGNSSYNDRSPPRESRFGGEREGRGSYNDRSPPREPRFGGEREGVGRGGELRSSSFTGRVPPSGGRFGDRDSRFGGGGRGGRGGRGRERRGDRMMSTMSGGGGGRGALVSEEEEVYQTRKGKQEKMVSGFLDLVGGDVSEEDEDDENDGEGFQVKSGSEVKSSSTPTSAGTDDSYLSDTRFDECAVSPLSLKAIKDVGYEKMTMVQAATLPVILKGADVMAKARTGTGKTVAFLLPSIEVVTKTRPADRDDRRPPILVLVICPTRELANQAAKEATTLVKYHPSIGVQVVIGGTRLAIEQKRMQTNPCQILVATPGRFRDHIENTPGFATRLKGVKVLVLDEADHLLDMGFRKDIEKIVAAVPKERQTLLFSATIPDDVREICHIALKRNYEYINTVQEGTGDTHTQVKQTHLIAPLENQFSLLYAILKDHIADDVNYKVLVFCTTAMVTRLVADLLGELNLNVREIHSRKPQSYRTRVSDEFRKSKGLILVTSDVSARGVDYPDVTLVVQMGSPSDKAQYIHRLGRTGRKGKEGLGILVLAPWEDSFLNTIKDLPISKAIPPMVDPALRRKVELALSHVEMKNKEAAYQAWLGYYNSNRTAGRDKTRLVELANEFSRSMGLDIPPAIPKLVLGKMGLKNVPGLRSR